MNTIGKLLGLIILFCTLTVNGQSGKPCPESLSKYPDLENQAIKKVAALYPAEPGFHVSGKVAVRIVVDKKGSVVSARMVCGHPLLAAPSVAAAIQWKFQPKRVNGKAVKNVGILIFDFSDRNGERSG